MLLLEVIRGKNTSKEVIQSCMTLGKTLKKMPVLSGNCHGFIGNRMLDPYIKEALHLVEEGASPAQIDRVMKEVVGFAMGPFEVSDLAGIDIGWKGRKELTERAVKEQGTVPIYVPPKPAATEASSSDSNSSGTVSSGPIDPATVTPSSFSLEGVPSLIPQDGPRRPLLLSDWYSALPELFTEKGMLGQKTKSGFYAYRDPKNPRKPSENPDALDLIAQHRKNLVRYFNIIPTTISFLFP
jgi:3-hydroxyacyl-CoA dehydrogenase